MHLTSISGSIESGAGARRHVAPDCRVAASQSSTLYVASPRGPDRLVNQEDGHGQESCLQAEARSTSVWILMGTKDVHSPLPTKAALRAWTAHLRGNGSECRLVIVDLERFMASTMIGWGEQGLGEGLTRTWTGVKGHTIDRLPLFGPVPDRKGLFLSADANVWLHFSVLLGHVERADNLTGSWNE